MATKHQLVQNDVLGRSLFAIPSNTYLGDVCGRLNILSDSASLYNREIARKALSGVCAPELLRSTLALLQGSIGYSEQVCQASYLHPNGFFRLTVAERPSRWALRFHFWPSCVSAENNDIHGHCGPLSSVLLYGALENMIFEPCDAEAPEYLEYEDKLESSTHHLTFVGRRKLRCRLIQVFSCGESYSLEREALHRTVPLSPFPVATLVLQGPKEHPLSPVFRLTRRHNVERVTTSCPPQVLRSVLSEMISYV